MYRKKLFLESVHKLGLGPEKENAVISLFEATHEDNLIADENPSDMQDALSGEIDEKPEGSALEETPNPKNVNKEAAKRIVNKIDIMLEPFRRVNVYQTHLSNSPYGTNLMVELGHRLNGLHLGGEYHQMHEALRNMSWEIIQFNKADDPSEAWKLQFNPGIVQTKKFNAITMIRKYMIEVDNALDIIKENLGII